MNAIFGLIHVTAAGMPIIETIAAALSAVCWIRSALLGAPVLGTFWDGPPKEVADRLKAQSTWNGWAAAFAAVAAAVHALSMAAASF